MKNVLTIHYHNDIYDNINNIFLSYKEMLLEAHLKRNGFWPVNRILWIHYKIFFSRFTKNGFVEFGKF